MLADRDKKQRWANQTEGRGTGIPMIRAAINRNGSPRAQLVADDPRLWFRVELPNQSRSSLPQPAADAEVGDVRSHHWL